MRLQRRTRFWLSVVGLLALGEWTTAISSAAEPPPPVAFDRDIGPLLTARCAKCHGPSAAEGGMRLTNREAAVAVLPSGVRAVVPGRPDESELLKRVSAADPDFRMPPKGPPLTADQIAKLRRWIAEGAAWPAHWAYRPLEKPPLPRLDSAGASWARTPIDRFIVRELAARGLMPSPPADKRTLLRRVYFDLIGLPPTPEEVEAFVADGSPDAYERVVDRLLASPQYGERWARHWMDVVHYAETHGHDQDRPRDHAWPYRDYLIRAFNLDTPYDRFVREQIAGDVLYPDDPWALVATGLLATGPWDESSLRDIREDAIDREIGRYLDRDDIVTTVMSTFVSSTVHCARCHDHKFDPIKQTEYYGLQAVFAGTDKANRTYDADPGVAARRRELTERKEALPRLRAAKDAALLDARLHGEIAQWEKSVAAAASMWRVLQPLEYKSAGGATLTPLDDGSLRSGGPRPEKDTYTIVAPTDLRRVTGIRLELLTDDTLPHKGPGRQDNGNLHLNELIVYARGRDSARGRVSPRREDESRSNESTPAKRLTLQNPTADFNQQGWSIDMALDGNPATAWGIYPEVGRPHRAVIEVKEPAENEGGTVLTFELQQTHGGGHLIGRVRLSVTDAPHPLPLDGQTLPAEIASILAVAPPQRSAQQKADLAAYYLGRQIDSQLAALPKPQMIYCGTNQFVADGSFRPAPTPRPVHVLQRGDVAKPGPVAAAGALACVPRLEHRFKLSDANDEGARRAALARWIADPSNVLTWRSMANRVWHYHFGGGLVDTPNDFGRMGGVPSHGELLDWLAVSLRDGGGSLKELHRLIVTSAVYRQSSVGWAVPTKSAPPTALRPGAHLVGTAHPTAIDADNRYLWRMNRQRLDAEPLHDAVLVVSGMLDRRMGGPSVKQFIQTPGVHVTPNVDYAKFDADDPANYRRSVYRFVFRTLPDPFMDALDCPDASQWTPQRNVSVTALQALAMLNDKFIVRQSEHVAERIAAASPGARIEERVRQAYRLILLRAPSDQELKAVSSYAQRHGLANACRMLLNTNEFVFVD